MFLTRISVAQPVFTTMVMAAIMVFGLAGWRVLPLDRFPPFDFPVVVVQTQWSGATPEAVETEISRPMEDALSTLAGIESLTSTSTAAHSSVEVMFSLETDSRQAAQDVRDRLAAVIPDLPAAAEAPEVMRFNPLAAPVLSLAISSPSLDPAALTRLARDVIVPALTSVEGVGSAALVGARDRQVEIGIDPDRLRAAGIGVTDVIAALEAGNLLSPAGSVEDDTGSRPVQIDARASSLAELEDVIVARPGGAAVRLAEVATLGRGTADPASLAFQDGRPALAIDVVKTDGANTVAVAHGVADAVARLTQGTALGVTRIDVLLNSADEIEGIYKTLRATLIEGIVLAVAIVFLFLNSWRSTVITALTLPISFLGALAVMSLLGFSLNTLSMLALTLSVGILIDDAIIVRENITRHLHMGKDHAHAALDGTREIGLAVLATTLALCAVFLPLAFMSGIIGRMFMQFGVTVAVAVLISMFVSFTLDPMLSSVWHDPDSEPGVRRGPIGRAVARFDRGFAWLGEKYRGLLYWCLARRKTTLALAVASLAGSFALLPLVGVEFLPKTDESRVSISFRTAVGSAKDYTALKAAQVTAILEELAEVAGVYATVAAGNASANEAQLEVSLVPAANRATSAEAMVPALRSLLRQVPGIESTIGTPGGVGPDDAPITLFVTGQDPRAVALTAEEVGSLLAAIPGTADVRLSVSDAQPLTDFRVLHDVASDLGVAPQAVGSALRALINGAEVSEMNWPDATIEPVVLRLPEPLRRDPAALSDLPVARSGGATITLGEVALREDGVGPPRIERRDRSRVIVVTAALDGRVLSDVMTEVTTALAALNVPGGVSVGLGGDADLMGDTVVSMTVALIMAVVFIYLVLASQFASFLQPLAIMASLPLAFSGVVLGLLVGGSTVNLYSMIGIVMLMGLVVKNAILLVDNANQHRRLGMTLHEALLIAGVTRFRPIMMTTLAMIFGMLPLAVALHPGSEQSASMAQAVIGGLVTSTLLTLVVVPVALVYVDCLTASLRRLFAGRALTREYEVGTESSQ